MASRCSSGVLTVLVLFLVSPTVPAQMSGTYTIDPSKPRTSINYQTIQSALEAVRTPPGISGPVFFKVASTTFRETLSVNTAYGGSQTAAVTFEAEGLPAVIHAPAVEPAHCIVMNRSARWYRFKNFKLTGYIRSGIYFDQTSSSGISGNVFERVEIDDGGTSWPNIQAIECHGSSYMPGNEFIRCVFRANGTPVLYGGAEGLFDGCEFDGKGRAGLVFSPVGTPRAYSVVRNCLFHGCGPTANCVEIAGPMRAWYHNTIVADTAGAALRVRAYGSSWQTTPIVRNNVVVNLGTGSAIEFAANNSAELYMCDADFNCYYAPNSVRAVLAGSPTLPFYAGSLANFLVWQKGPGRIQSGGATAYDPNSMETNPKLVRMTAPMDIHLMRGSPLIDRGTTMLVPSYVTNFTATVSRDFENDIRVAPVDIGADEVGFSVYGVGTGTVGSVMEFRLSAQFDAGLRYQLGTSLGPGPIFIGNRTLGLNFDGLLLISIGGVVPSVFQDYGGVLDSAGKATARLAILNVPALKGIKLYTAFVTIRIGAPQNIESLSNTFTFTIQ